jgi:4-hydroxy-tetrahydrodipicolinate synthase
MNPEGIYVPNVTPFNEKGEIVFDELDRLVEFWIKNKVSGIVANASTGEGPYLGRDEKTQLIQHLVKTVDGRAQVFAGTGSMSTHETIQLTQDARDAGAEAALITTPFFFKPSDSELYHHFVDVIEAVEIPVILYNVPKFTGYSINPLVVAKIAEECSNLVAIKDSSGNPANMAEVIRLCGEEISALSGSADMILPTLMLGGKGAIVAVANVIPGDCTALKAAYRERDLLTAGKYQHKASHVNKVLIRENPQIAAIKAALNMMGYKAGIPRRPLRPLPEGKIKEIMEPLSEYSLL